MRTLFIAFASRRLTITCLVFAMALLATGLFSQAIGATDQMERSHFFTYVVTWVVPTTEIAIPFLPGGYTIGIVLGVNLLMSLVMRFRFDSRRISLSIIYIGIVLFIIAEFISSLESRSSAMTLKTGDSARYSENSEDVEIALITAIPDSFEEQVITIPQEILKRERETEIAELPFIVSVDRYLPHTSIVDRTPANALSGPIADAGIGKLRSALPGDESNGKDDGRSAYVTLYSSEEILGTWLLNESFEEQTFQYLGVRYRMSLRPERYYYPFTLSLKNLRRENHGSTDTLKALEATLEIQKDDTGEKTIKTISPGRAFNLGEISIFVNSQSLKSPFLRIHFSQQPVKRLFTIATIMTCLGLSARLIAFLLVWLKDTAKEAP